MTLTELRYIVTLARERHFGRAAEKCHVSQPTLSVALKKVEQKYGVILFERTPVEVRLTPTGEQIARQAERVLEALKKWHVRLMTAAIIERGDVVPEPRGHRDDAMPGYDLIREAYETPGWRPAQIVVIDGSKPIRELQEKES